MIKELVNEKDYGQLSKKEKVLIDFNADWCGPCKMMEPHLEKLSENYPDILILKINVDKFNEIASRFMISSIPTLILFKNGKVIKTNIGYVPYPQLERLIK